MLNVCSLYQPYIKVLHGVYDNSWKCRFTLNYMSLVSLLTRFSLFRAQWMCLAEKMSRNPTNSLFSFLCCTRQLINADIYHVFTFLQNRSQNYSFFMRFLQLRMFFLSQSVIFLAFTGFYDLFCRKVTHVSIEIWFLFIYIFMIYRGKSYLFSIIVMQINAPSTRQIPSEGWYCSHQWHP